MSNIPIPPSPSPSRSRPGYGGYHGPRGGTFYGSGAANSNGLRGDSWRAEPSYRPRDPNADHYEPEYDNDRSRLTWGGVSYPQSQAYDPADPWPRRDVMAESMLEPSDSWRNDHAPDQEVDASERFAEDRARMPPPRDDFAYPYDGDSYRDGSSWNPRRGSAFPRQSDHYRPNYTEEGRWNPSYSVVDGSTSWGRQRSPGSASRPRGRQSYGDASYDKSFSGSPRSSRFSSPKHSRVGASQRHHSRSSSSIRSSRERSKSPPRSRDRSRSSGRSSVDSHPYGADSPTRPHVLRSHPLGQSRGRRRGGQRAGGRFQGDNYRGDSGTAPFTPSTYPNDLGPGDRFAPHPSLPQRPTSPYLTPGPGGRNRFPDRGFTGPPQGRFSDLQGGRGSAMSSNASQSGRSKRKRRGGVNRKKRAMFQQQGGPFFRDGYADSNSTPLPAGGPRGFSIPHTPYPGEDFKPQIDFPSLPGSMPEPPPPSRVLEDYHVPVPLKSEVRSPVVADRGFPPTVSETKEAAPGLFGAAPPVPSEKPSSIPLEAAYTAPPEQERPESSVVEAAVSGAISELPQSTSTNKPGPPHSSLSELPRLIIPSPEPPDSPMYSPQDLFLEVASPDSLVPSQSTLFSPVPVAVATPQPMPSEPSAEPSSTPQSLPVLSLPGATTSSPVSSAAPTPSLQTPSPPHVAPEVIVAAPAVQEPEDELVPKSPVSSALHAAGVPAAVRPDGGIFPVSAKEPEFFGEALHIVIDARRLVDIQSRGERVNPILFSNCTIAPASPEEPAPSAHAPAQEVAAGERNRGTIRAFDTHVRNSLVANMAARQETVDEKVTRLRKEYLALHKEWVARCADLDESHKVDAAAGEVAAIPARTTRRSAAVLGDAVRSDLEMEQIIASLGNDELYDPAHLALRNVAVIPDMISVTHGKVDAMFDDTNNLVRDPQTFYDPIPSLAEWTSEEVEIFKQRFAKWPKQFGHIAAGLEHKTQAQCVQFYYLHKKTLIDFREAITTYGQSKRRRGGRKTDKKKGGLIADIRQHDAEVSKEQDPVKRRAGATTRKRREPTAQPPKRTAPRRSATAAMQQEEQTPAATPTPDPEPAPTPPVPAPAPDPPARPKRRRNNRAGAGAAAETDSAATEEPPAKRRRAPRKSKLVVSETSTPEPTKAASEAPAETASVPVEGPSEQPTQRRSSAWSADDIEQFLGLLAQYGKDFKRIAASMPNKTTMQVGNFYTANLDRYDLKPIAAKAPGRSPTPNPPPETKEETPQPSTSAPGVVHEQAFTISDVPPMSATSRSHLLDLQTHPYPIPGPPPSSTLHLFS